MGNAEYMGSTILLMMPISLSHESSASPKNAFLMLVSILSLFKRTLREPSLVVLRSNAWDFCHFANRSWICELFRRRVVWSSENRFGVWMGGLIALPTLFCGHESG